MAGARGIEPRSKVLETFILTVVLCPFMRKIDYTRTYLLWFLLNQKMVYYKTYEIIKFEQAISANNYRNTRER